MKRDRKVTKRFVICDQGIIEANPVPDNLLAKPGSCPPGIYETVLMCDGKPADWAAHWDRLMTGLKYLGIDQTIVAGKVTPDSVELLAERNSMATGYSRLRIEVFHHKQYQ